MSDGEFDELARIAGGDDYELARDEIRSSVLAARRRLREQFPYFYEEEP